jgi:hypothetical protein
MGDWGESPFFPSSPQSPPLPNPLLSPIPLSARLCRLKLYIPHIRIIKNTKQIILILFVNIYGIIKSILQSQ